MWLPTVVGAGALLLLLLALWLGREGRGPGPDESDPGSDGGGGPRRPPPPPPPVGPVSWAEFEREFAAFVAAQPARPAEDVQHTAKDASTVARAG
jgi:hypothetical protein